MNPVGIFWDYENCRPPSFMSGYTVVERIWKTVQSLGSISVFKAYLDVNLEASRGIQLQDLQSSGVSLIHTPHSTNKKVADKVLLVDLLVFALEGQGKKTIVIITDDQDFNYAVSTLRMRGHDICIISSPRDTHRSLHCLANGIFDWRADILKLVDEPIQKPNLSAQGCFPTSPIRADSLMPTPALASAKLVSPAPLHAGTVEERAGMQGVAKSDMTSRSCARTLADSIHVDHESIMPESNGVLPSQDAFSVQAADTDLDDCTLIPCLEQVHENHMATQEDRLDINDIGSPSLSDTRSDATRVDKEKEVAEDTGMHPASAETMSKIPSAVAEVVSEDAPSPACKATSSHVVPMANLSFPGVEIFSDLVEVLEHERSLGRLSAACRSLELLLLEANPRVYEIAEVSGLREYLEAAQRANIIFFTISGHIFLRTQYAGRFLKESDSLEDSIHPPHSLCSGGVNPSVQETPSTPSTHGYNKPIDPKFKVLVDELRTLRSKGQVPIRRGSLSPKLLKRDPLVYSRSGFSKVKGYISRAADMGVVLLQSRGKKGKQSYVSLHPDYY